MRAIEHWLSLNKLKLNKNKTQGIPFSRLASKSAADTFGNNFSDPIALKCIILDCNMSMEEQIKSVRKCYFEIRNLGNMRKYANEKKL